MFNSEAASERYRELGLSLFGLHEVVQYCVQVCIEAFVEIPCIFIFALLPFQNRLFIDSFQVIILNDYRKTRFAQNMIKAMLHAEAALERSPEFGLSMRVLWSG